MNWLFPNQFDASAGGALTQTFDFIDNNTTTTWTLPDPLVDWLPNSCLHEKYIPTWHLVRSYK